MSKSKRTWTELASSLEDFEKAEQFFYATQSHQAILMRISRAVMCTINNLAIDGSASRINCLFYFHILIQRSKASQDKSRSRPIRSATLTQLISLLTKLLKFTFEQLKRRAGPHVEGDARVGCPWTLHNC